MAKTKVREMPDHVLVTNLLCAARLAWENRINPNDRRKGGRFLHAQRVVSEHRKEELRFKKELMRRLRRRTLPRATER